MPYITKRTLRPLLFPVILICVGYIAAQQSPSQQSGRTQSVAPQSTQPTPQQQTEQVAQLQMQVKDLQAAIDDLKTEQQMIKATAKETHELVLDSRAVQKQDRESLRRAVVQNEHEIDNLGRQANSMMRDLVRVKTKVGLY